VAASTAAAAVIILEVPARLPAIAIPFLLC
jgi:hypothetical protein